MDEAILRVLNGLATLPGVGVTCRFVDGRAGTLLLVGLLLLRAWRLRRWGEAVRVGLAGAVADVVVVRVFKPIVGRIRPCHQLADLVLPAGCGSGEAFPSAHAAALFAVAAVLGRPWAWVLATLVALSRVVAGVHWPSDILGGALLGTGIGLAIRYLIQRGSTGRGTLSGPPTQGSP
ncbi:MAG: phosphatase PAP2 family protein [Deltaproteobacteria bacterium]|nr:phosphatase PAP2 family protein [Deltaproteobacteria bacterium]